MSDYHQIYESARSLTLLERLRLVERLVSDLAAQVTDPSDLETPRPIGLARGAFEVPEAFFDPLPDDLLEAFSGAGADPHP
jgi:hypothetical protein